MTGLVSLTARFVGARRSAAFLVFALLVTGCVGSTGSDLFEFDAFAAGPKDARAGEPYTFETGRGYTVTLDHAVVHVGAVYLNRSVPTSVSSDTTCTLPGIYVAEVPGGLSVDVLSSALQRFPVSGQATEGEARTGEVWLTGGDVNAAQDPTAILAVAGTAEGPSGDVYPFEGSLTIGENRLGTPPDPGLPGARPICKQRVVAPIVLGLAVKPGGALILRVDPRGFFANVDFSSLATPEGTAPYEFVDGPSDQASNNLYGGLRAAHGTYSIAWSTASERDER
jgi:hypothetical protein